MKTQSKLAILAFAALLFTLNSCKKETTSVNSNNTIKSVSSAGTGSYVLTPDGRMLKSHVFMIEQGHGLSIQNGHVYKVNLQTRTLEKDLGLIHVFNKANPFLPSVIPDHQKNLGLIKQNVPGQQVAGWITYAGWLNPSTTQFINYFATDYTVPNAPPHVDTQVVYYFEGLQYYGDDIMQPVLLWGYNGNYGGNYWSIANWYVWSVTNQDGSVSQYGAYSQPTLNISPGTVLHGKITYTGQTSGSDNYISSFSNYPASDMNITEGNTYNHGTIPQVLLQNKAYETLEAYKSAASQIPEVTYYSDYSTNSYGKMSNISLLINNQPAPLQWTTATTSYAQFGESTAVINPNADGTGQVNLYCYPPYTIPVSVNMTPSSTLHAVVVGVNPTDPNFFGVNDTFTSASTQNYIAYEPGRTFSIQVTTVTQRCHVTINGTYTQDTQGGHTYVSFNNITLNGNLQISVVPF